MSLESKVKITDEILDDKKFKNKIWVTYNPRNDYNNKTEFLYDNDMVEQLESGLFGKWKFYMTKYRDGKKVKVFKHSGGL